MNKIAILSTTRYVPETYVLTEDICKEMGIDDNRLKSVGIRKVHVAKDEDAYDMALKCGKRILEKDNIDRMKIKYLVYASAVNEYIIADYAMKLCRELELWNAETININQFCCGSLVALEYLNYKLKDSEEDEYGLVITSECFHDIGINRWMAASTLYYGDGASAALLHKADQGLIICDSNDITSGKYNDMWKIPTGGLKSNLCNTNDIKELFHYEFSNSKDMSFQTSALLKLMAFQSKKVVMELLARNDLDIKSINHFVMYNPGVQMFDFLVKVIKVDKTSVFNKTATEYGHMGSTDIIFNLDYMLESGENHANDRTVLFSMESGLSFRSILLENKSFA